MPVTNCTMIDVFVIAEQYFHVRPLLIIDQLLGYDMCCYNFSKYPRSLVCKNEGLTLISNDYYVWERPYMSR